MTVISDALNTSFRNKHTNTHIHVQRETSRQRHTYGRRCSETRRDREMGGCITQSRDVVDCQRQITEHVAANDNMKCWGSLPSLGCDIMGAGEHLTTVENCRFISTV